MCDEVQDFLLGDESENGQRKIVVWWREICLKELWNAGAGKNPKFFYAILVSEINPKTKRSQQLN